MFESSRFLPASRLVAAARRHLMSSMDCASITSEGVLRAAISIQGRQAHKVSYSGMVIAADKLALADQQLVQEVPDADYS